MLKKRLVQLGLISIAFVVLVGCSNEKGNSKEKKTETSIESKIEDVTVRNTKYGAVKGKKNKEILIWQGVPYGGDTSGENRWKKPSEPKKWNDVLDTTKPGDVAIQPSADGPIGSENGLNLDIYRPNNDSTDLPVLVFLHGGNNQSGHAQEISGVSFVKNHNAIIVSVNYRLGVLGFNPLQAVKKGDKEENSGNIALLDISQSLDWVRENISEFGGDSNNVTISGFSAGGRDVMAMLISPMFEGKFDKAISLSGGMTVADEAKSQQVFAEALAPLVVEDKVKDNVEEATKWLLTDDREVTEYLYKIDAERLTPLMANASIRMEVFPHLYADGEVIPKEGFETKNYNEVPLMMLSGEQEFSLFGRFDPYFAESVKDNTINTDEEKVKEYNFVNNYGGKLYGLFNLEDSAEKMKENYDAPIYGMEILFGEDEAVVGKEMGVFGSFHGVFVPLLDTDSKNYEGLVGDAYDSKGAKDLANIFQEYVYQFISDDIGGKETPVKWEEWKADSKENILFLDADKEKVSAKMGSKEFNYNEVLEEMKKDESLPTEKKEELSKKVLNGRWFSYELDKELDNLSNFYK